MAFDFLYLPGRTVLPLLLAARDSGWLRPFTTMLLSRLLSSFAVYIIACFLTRDKPARQSTNVIATEVANLLVIKSNSFKKSVIRAVIMTASSHPTWFAVLLGSCPGSTYSSVIYVAASAFVGAAECALVSGNSKGVTESLLGRDSLYNSPQLDVVLAIKYIKLAVILSACIFALLRIKNKRTLLMKNKVSVSEELRSAAINIAEHPKESILGPTQDAPLEQ